MSLTTISRARAAALLFGGTALTALRVPGLAQTNAPGVLLLGRPYNIHDSGVNLSVAQKLRDFYGVNCIPLDMLDVDSVDVRDVKVEAERLRSAGVEVGIVLELTGQMRLLDVYDPDGNRVQLAQEL